MTKVNRQYEDAGYRNDQNGVLSMDTEVEEHSA